jgi:hypothetical protein
MKINHLIVEKSQTLSEKPQGTLSRLGNKVASAFGSGKAQGKLDTGAGANQLRKEFDVYLGQTGQTPTGEIVLSFLKSKGYPTSKAANAIGITDINAAQPAAAPAQPQTPAPAADNSQSQVPAAGTSMGSNIDNKDYGLGQQSDGKFIYPGQKFDTETGAPIAQQNPAAANTQPSEQPPADTQAAAANTQPQDQSLDLNKFKQDQEAAKTAQQADQDVARQQIKATSAANAAASAEREQIAQAAKAAAAKPGFQQTADDKLAMQTAKSKGIKFESRRNTRPNLFETYIKYYRVIKENLTSAQIDKMIMAAAQEKATTGATPAATTAAPGMSTAAAVANAQTAVNSFNQNRADPFGMSGGAAGSAAGSSASSGLLVGIDQQLLKTGVDAVVKGQQLKPEQVEEFKKLLQKL